jgi:hypothetical protein
MKNNFWNKRIPTLLGIFILTFGLGLTTFLTNKETFFQIRASANQQPQNVRITNVSDTSFTVSYTTVDKSSGSVNYGKDQALGSTALDSRDKQTGGLKSYQIHNFEITNLSPQTKYFFTIISGQNTYLNNNQAFQITTGPKVNISSENTKKIKGSVVLPSGGVPSEAIVYITSGISEVYSSLVKQDGTYEIPLNQIRTNTLESYYAFNDKSVIKMLAYGDTLTSNVSFLVNQAALVPTVTLSKDYDFVTSDAASSTSNIALDTFPSFESTSSANSNKKPQILTPTKNEGFTDDQPLFKGTGLPKEDVQIIIHSDEKIQTQVTTDKNGNWTYRPSETLSPGDHTITIITRDASGILKTITQSFVVYAAGTQIANAAGSPTPTTTPIPTPTTTPRLTTTLTPTPTITPSVINSFVSTPTSTLTPTPISTSAAGVLPPTGNPSIITIGILGIAITLFGTLLFLLTRGAIKL